MTIETKYSIGHIVWFIAEPHSFGKKEQVDGIIEEIQYRGPGKIVYKMEQDNVRIYHPFLKESQLFKSKEDLLNSLLNTPHTNG